MSVREIAEAMALFDESRTLDTDGNVKITQSELNNLEKCLKSLHAGKKLYSRTRILDFFDTTGIYLTKRKGRTIYERKAQNPDGPFRLKNAIKTASGDKFSSLSVSSSIPNSQSSSPVRYNPSYETSDEKRKKRNQENVNIMDSKMQIRGISLRDNKEVKELQKYLFRKLTTLGDVAFYEKFCPVVEGAASTYGHHEITDADLNLSMFKRGILRFGILPSKLENGALRALWQSFPRSPLDTMYTSELIRELKNVRSEVLADYKIEMERVNAEKDHKLLEWKNDILFADQKEDLMDKSSENSQRKSFSSSKLQENIFRNFEAQRKAEILIANEMKTSKKKEPKLSTRTLLRLKNLHKILYKNCFIGKKYAASRRLRQIFGLKSAIDDPIGNISMSNFIRVVSSDLIGGTMGEAIVLFNRFLNEYAKGKSRSTKLKSDAAKRAEEKLISINDLISSLERHFGIPLSEKDISKYKVRKKELYMKMKNLDDDNNGDNNAQYDGNFFPKFDVENLSLKKANILDMISARNQLLQYRLS
eukprot:g2330.t1